VTAPAESNSFIIGAACVGTVATIATVAVLRKPNLFGTLFRKIKPPVPPPPPTPAQLEAAQLFGKQHLMPDSPEFAAIKDKILALTSHRDLPVIDFRRLTNLAKFTPGFGEAQNDYHRVFRAKLDGVREVVIKTIPLGHFDRIPGRGLTNYDPTRLSDTHLNELKSLLLLNKLNLAPELFGLTHLNAQAAGKIAAHSTKGELAFVSEYVPGKSLPLHRIEPEEKLRRMNITSQTIEDIRNTGELMQKAGYTTATDLQFLIKADGRAELIDPEFFDHPQLARDPDDARQLTPPESPTARAQKYIEQLRPFVRP
jgi:hypothetical protein